MLLFLVMLLFSAICSVISFGDEAIRRTEQTLFPISSKFVCRSGPHRMMSLRRLLLLDRHRRCLRKLRLVGFLVIIVLIYLNRIFHAIIFDSA